MTWLPIETFFADEPSRPDVRLLAETGEVIGFYDEDSHCWRAADDNRQLQPIGWKPHASPFDKRRPL